MHSRVCHANHFCCGQELQVSPRADEKTVRVVEMTMCGWAMEVHERELDLLLTNKDIIAT